MFSKHCFVIWVYKLWFERTDFSVSELQKRNLNIIIYYSLRKKNNVNLAILNTYVDLREILGSHNSDLEDHCLLGCDAE
jgi:hypothetical protein